MPEIIVTFSGKKEDVKTIEKIQEIAKRENRSRSFIIVRALEEYAKAHGEGNSSYRLDEFEEGLVAYPTAWLPFGEQALRAMSDNEVIDLNDKLLARVDQVNSDVKRRYPSLSGYRDFKKFKMGEGIQSSKRRR